MGSQIWKVLALSLYLIAGFVFPSVCRGSSGATHAGGTPSSGLSVAKRHRIELGVGYWDTGEAREISTSCASRLTTDVEDLLLTLSYGYWLQEKLSATISLRTLVVEARATSGPSNACESGVVMSSVLFGLRYYPLATPQSPLRPYVAASAGPYLGVESRWGVGPDSSRKNWTQGSFGGALGGGLDIQAGRYFMLDLNVGYNVMKDFSEPLAGKRNYNGFEYGIGLSVLFGKGN